MKRHAKALVAVVFAMLCLGASAAFALQTHEPTGDIDPSGTPNGAFGSLYGLAVDQSGGDLYLTDASGAGSPVDDTGAIHRYDSAGIYLDTIDGAATTPGTLELQEPADVAVDSSSSGSDGNFYVTDNGHGVLDAFDSSGAVVTSFGDTEGGADGQLHGIKTGPGSFGFICGVAVDQSNANILISDRANNRVWVYDSSGKFLTGVSDSNLSEPCGIATTSTGDFYVKIGDGRILRFNKASGSEYNYGGIFYAPDFVTEFSSATDVAVNTATDYVYVDKGDHVTEYDAGGSKISDFGQGTLGGSGAIAVDSNSGKVYAGEGSVVHTFGPLIILPDATTGAATDVTGTTATVKGTVDAAGGPEASCEFEYGTDESYGSSAPCEPEGPYPGSEAVSAQLSGLSPTTTYHYRLHATSAEGETNSADMSFTTDGAPLIESFSVGEVGSTSARLSARINPSGAATAYRFSYTTKADFDANGFANATKAPLPDGSIPAGSATQQVSALISGLDPSSAYVFMVSVENAVAGAESAAKAFTTFAAAQTPVKGQFPGKGFLPSDRAWEMVSPPDKNGGDVAVRSQRTQAAADCASGCALTFASLSGFADVAGTGVATEYMATRAPGSGSNGWLTRGITPKQDPMTLAAALSTGEPMYEREFSPDLDTAVFRAISPLSDDPYVANVPNLYTRSGLRGPGPVSNRLESACAICETETHTPLPNWDSMRATLPYLAGHTEDFDHVLFESSQNLTGDGAGVPKLYQSDAGQVRLIGRVPPGSETSCGGGGPACVLPDGTGGSVAGVGALQRYPLPGVLSENGDRANFSAPVTSQGAAEAASQVYQRDSHGTLTTADDTTVKLSASEKVAPDAPSGVSYQTASSDGRRVFLLSGAPLTDDAPPGGRHLYMWHDDFLNDEVQKLTVEASAGEFRLLLDGEETGDLPFNATPAQIKTAIETLPAVAAGNGEVTVTGGPGDETGQAPYTITFGGGLAETDQPTMATAAGSTPLSGGAAGATVAPWVKGGGHLTLIDVDREPGDGSGGIDGVIGASADGSYIYFGAGNQLVAGEPLLTNNLEQGIYLWHEGTVTYIGSFMPPSEPRSNWTRNVLPPLGTATRAGELRSRVAPNGKALLFSATNSSGLSGYDHGTCVDSSVGTTPCREIYLYHPDSDDLSCVSCHPGGAAATAHADTAVFEGALNTAWATHENHSLSDDGRYVFFSTAERLVPEDRNGKSDAYQYDSQSEEVHLLSSGFSDTDSYFVEASADGHDVFIATKERLSGWDVDSVYDFYDARIGGGLPEPLPAPPSCQGDACQPAPLSLNDQTPSSSSFAGAGNQKGRRAKARCGKGRHRVKARGGKSRCVKAKKHRRKRNANSKRRAGG